MPDTDVLEKSVTKNDYTDKNKSGVLQFFIGAYGGLGAMPSLPPFWSHERDLVLMATIYREPVWASAVWKFCTRQIARQWEIKSDVPLRARKAQELFLDLDDGRGWASGIFKHLQSYRLTGNGGWIEIVRATSARGSKIIGLVPLDPLRCTRTGNPSEPIIYRDVLGNLHWLKDYQCFNITDQPDTGAMFYSLGHCAAERAYNKILQMEGLERYFLEKLTGRRPTAVHIVNGLTLKQIQSAYETAEEDANRKGIQSYMGVAIATVVDPGAQLSLVTIPITEVPDGFNAAEERTEAKLVYANSVGIPVAELDPRITAPRALSSAQDLQLTETSEGQNVWEKDWIHACNKYALDNRTYWVFPDLNLRDELLRAQVTGARASAYKTMKYAEFITATQGTQKLVDENELPESFLPTGDQTPTETLTDEEKPIEEVVPNGAEVESVPESELLTDEVEMNEVKKNLAHKSIGDYGQEFEKKLQALVKSYLAGRINKRSLSSGMLKLIRSRAEKIYTEGMYEVGEYDSPLDAQDALTKEDIELIDTWEKEQSEFAKQFINDVAAILILASSERSSATESILNRTALWRKSLEGFGELAKMNELEDEIGVWELGDTEEHCDDSDGYSCLELDGQAHRMSYYAERGLTPGTPGSKTTCKGYECRCKIRSKRTGKVIAG